MEVPSSSGSIDVPSSSGNIEVTNSTGDMEVASSSGCMEVPSSSGNMEVPSSSGNKEVPSSSGNTEVPISSNINQPMREILLEYTFDTRPAIRNIKRVPLLPNKWMKRFDVLGSKEFPKMKRRYFEELNVLINLWRKKVPDIVVDDIKKGFRLPYFFSDVMVFIASQLGKRDLKPLLLLKAFYYFFLNAETLVEKNEAIKVRCINYLKKFLIHSLKSKDLRYLLKDMATDILFSLGYVSYSNIPVKLVTQDFRYVHYASDDFYGMTIAWLSNLTLEIGVRFKHCDVQGKDTLSLRALNSPKVFRRMISICESCVCCVPSQLHNVSFTETHNSPSRSEGVILKKTDDLPNQSNDFSSVEQKPLYDLSLVKNMNNIFRNETIYTPIFHIKYEQRLSKPFQFSSLILKETKARLLSHADAKCPDKFDGKKFQDASDQPKDLPESFYVSEHKSSYMLDDSFWASWDIFSGIQTHTDPQLVFFGYLSPCENTIHDKYSNEKASVCNTFTSLLDMDPIYAENNQNLLNSQTSVFESFDLSMLSQSKRNRKRKLKRKLSPST